MYPDVHFPEPYLDSLAAAKHFLSPEILARYAIDPERVAVSGDSSGGNLAAALAQEVHTEAISCRDVGENTEANPEDYVLFVFFSRFQQMTL